MKGRFFNFSLRDCAQRRAHAIKLPLVVLVAFYGACLVNQQRANAADDSQADSSAPVIGFRRVFVPADKTEAWPLNGEKLLPIESKDFEEWVAAENRPSQPAARASIVEAKYLAEWKNGRLESGHGTWKISHHGTQPTVLSLDDMSLALRNARWLGEQERPVRLGAWGSPGSLASGLGLEVVASGVLEFDWSAQSESSGDHPSPREALEIPWRLPPASLTHLVLDLPAGKEPKIDGGVVLKVNPIENPKNQGGSWRRWELACAPTRAAVLQIADAHPATDDSPTGCSVRDDTSYHVSHRGVDIVSTMNIANPTEPKREFAIRISRRMQLVAAECNGQKISWRVENESESDAARVIVKLPEGLDQRTLQIVLHAWHPLVVNESWHLPKLRPEGALWTSGVVQFSIDDGFEIRALKPIGCVETGIANLGGGQRSAETWQFAAYSAAAEIETTVSTAPRVAVVRQCSTLTLNDPDFAGRLTSKWTLAYGAAHVLTGDLAPGWAVESVEAIPSDALREWFVDKNGNQQQLEIQLSSSAAPNRDVTVIVNARLPRSEFAGQLSADSMRMVAWRDARVTQKLVAFETSEPIVVEPVRSLAAISTNELTEEDRSLLDASVTPSAVFDLTHSPEGAAAKLAPERGQFDAEIRQTATLAGSKIREEHRLIISPINSGIDHILVYVSIPIGASLQWNDLASRTQITSQKLPADDARMKAVPAAGELWLLQLTRPTSGRIELVATVELPWEYRGELPLLALPEATQQTGYVQFQSDAGQSIAIDPRGMTAAPIPESNNQDASRQTLPIRAAYRYSPADVTAETSAPRLAIDSTAPSVPKSPAAKWARMESFFSADGAGSHRAVYEFDNDAPSKFEVQFPANAQVRSILVNDQNARVDLAAASQSASARKMQLPLPQGTAIVSINFDTASPPLKVGSVLNPPRIDRQARVLAGEWILQLPEDFSIASEQPASWRERLFGPLARPTTARPFQPLQKSDWTMLLNSLTRPHIEETSSSQSLPGWHSFRTTFIANEPAPVYVTRPAATNTWMISALLLSVVVGALLRRRSAALFVACITFAAAVALVLPVAFAPVAAGAVLGLLLSMFVPRLKERAATEFGASTHWHRFSTIGTLVLVTAGISARLALGEPTNGADVGASTQPAYIHRVLIPVNANKQPVGAKVYVDEVLARLMLGAQASLESANRWLIKSVSYEAALNERMESSDAVVGTLKATYEIETLVRDTTIRLPLVRSEADWSTSAMLDGAPVHVEWRNDGLSCEIRIAEPGQCSLTLSCSPRQSQASGKNVVTLSIPAFRGATLHVTHPAKLSGLAVAHGALQSLKDSPDNSHGDSQFELDDTQTLSIEWLQSDGTQTQKDTSHTVSLDWLKVSADGIELLTKYIFDGSADQGDELVVRFDPSWEIIPDEMFPVKVAAADASSRLLAAHLKLPKASAQRREVLLRWHLKNGNSFGRLIPPAIELVSHSVAQRWRAVTASESLECDLIDSNTPTGTAAEFLALWSNADTADTPQIVLGNVQPGDPWNILATPKQTEASIRETVHVAAEQSGLRVAYLAAIEPGTACRYQCSLSLPAELSVENVSIEAADRQVPLRWVRTADDHLNLFFSQEIVEPYQLVLIGRIGSKNGEPLKLPLISALPAGGFPTIQLYRDEDTSVVLSGVSPSEETTEAPADVPPAPWTARYVAGFRLTPDIAAKATIQIQPNECKLAGDFSTTLIHNDNNWNATLQCAFSVEKGTLDTLLLHVPPTWVGPFTLEAGSPGSINVASHDRKGSTLAIRFAESVPAGSSMNLKVSGALQFAASSVSVPEITSVPDIHGRRFISVPASDNGQTVQWNEAGVRLAEIPKPLLPSPGPATPTRMLEVTASPAHVVLQPLAGTHHDERIGLADVVVLVDERGGRLFTTRFTLDSYGQSHCTLQLPMNQEIVEVRVANRPALLEKTDSMRYRVALGPLRLPALVEVVTRTVTSGSPSSLQRPALLAGNAVIPVDINMWSIGYSLDAQRPAISVSQEMSAADFKALEFDRMLSITESATAAAATLPPPDGYHWFRSWASVLQQVRAEALQAMAKPAARQSASQVSRPLEEQLVAASGRLDAWIEKCDESLVDPSADDSPRHASAHPQPSSPSYDIGRNELEKWTYCVTDGALDHLTINFGDRTEQSLLTQYGGALSAMLLCIAAVGLWRWSPIADYLYQWPHAIGVLVGIAYWAWLRPSWLGLLIAALSVLFTFRTGWPGRAIRQDASTVLRASRPK